MSDFNKVFNDFLKGSSSYKAPWDDEKRCQHDYKYLRTEVTKGSIYNKIVYECKECNAIKLGAMKK